MGGAWEERRERVRCAFVVLVPATHTRNVGGKSKQWHEHAPLQKKKKKRKTRATSDSTEKDVAVPSAGCGLQGATGARFRTHFWLHGHLICLAGLTSSSARPRPSQGWCRAASAVMRCEGSTVSSLLMRSFAGSDTSLQYLSIARKCHAKKKQKTPCSTTL